MSHSMLSDEENERFAELVSAVQLANDVDLKIVALHRLSEDLPSFVSIPDADALTQTLKPLLKNPHLNLSSASLSFVPTFISHLRSDRHATHAVKVAVVSLTPILVERTGDTKERVRESAARALEELGKAAIDASAHALSSSLLAASSLSKGKEQETALVHFEKVIKEAGLSAKSARTREQICRLLPHLRMYNSKFPIKPFLPPLVDMLSDADPGCRESSKGTLIALFSQASPGAKADLKKELEKKGVRKPLAEAIAREVIAGGSVSREDEGAVLPEDSPRPAGPPGPSSAPTTRPATSMASASHSEENVAPVYIASKFDLERTFGGMLPFFDGKETEHNWLNRETSINKVRGMLKAGAYEQFDAAFIAGVKSLGDGVLKAVASLRTTLAMQGISLIAELASRLGDDLDSSIIDAWVPPLLKMAGFTKKIVATGTQHAAKQIFQNVTYRHRFLDLISAYMTDKTIATRVAMSEHLCTLLATHAEHRKHALESHDGLATIEKFLAKGLPDPNKDVRAKSRDAYYEYQKHWPARAAALFERMDASTKKQIAAGTPSGSASSSMLSPSGSSAAAPRAPLARRPGGPSSAILAAKRAASARMAKERRESSGEDGLAGPTPSTPPMPRLPSSGFAKVRPSSMAMPSPSLPASIPLPSSPSSSPGTLSPPARSPAIGALQGSSRPLPGTSYSSTSTPKRSSNLNHGAYNHDSGSTPLSRTRKTSLSGSSTGSSARSLKTRSVADFGGMAQQLQQQRRLSSGIVAKVRKPPPANDLDDTLQLGVDVDGDDDATMDLMGMTSPLRAAGGHNIDESLTIGGGGDDGGDESLHRSLDTGDDGDETTLATPRVASTKDFAAASEGTNGLPLSSSSETPTSMLEPGGTTPVANALTEATSSVTNRQPGVSGAPQSAGHKESAGWFLNRAQRLSDGPMSPLKSKPDALAWVQEVSEGRADAKVFKNLVRLSVNFRVSALPANGSLKPDSGSELQRGPRASQGLTGLKQMQNEDEGFDEEVLSGQTEAWREGDLFINLWRAMEKFFSSAGANGRAAPRMARSSPDLDMAALSLLWKLIDNQYPLFLSYSLESDLLELILRIRHAKTWPGIGSACESLVDVWAHRTVPALGLNSLLSTLQSFLATLVPEEGAAESRPKLQALGLLALAKLMSRLPPEVIEDELPKARDLVWNAFNDDEVVLLRQAAVEVMRCAYRRMLQGRSPAAGGPAGDREGSDAQGGGAGVGAGATASNGEDQGASARGGKSEEARIFEICGPLKQAQKDLLMYYFAKP